MKEDYEEITKDVLLMFVFLTALVLTVQGISAVLNFL